MLHLWPLAFLLTQLVLKCRNVKPIFTTHYHLYHSLSNPAPTQLSINGPKPQQQPTPISTSHAKPHPNPREVPAQMNSLLCIQNTWHPPCKKWQSPLILNQYTAIITSFTTQPAKPILNKPVHHPSTSITSTIHIKTFMTLTHTQMQNSTLSTHQLPIILSNAPVHPPHTHIPTPIKPPTVNLFDPYRRRLPTHGLPNWLKPWQQVRNGRAKKMDGRADGRKNNILHIFLLACSLVSFFFSFKLSLPFTNMGWPAILGLPPAFNLSEMLNIHFKS